MKKWNNSNAWNRRKFIQSTSLIAGSLLLPSLGRSFDQNKNNGKLKVRQEGNNFIIESPDFELCLNIINGLKAVWWLNKLTGRKLDMGNGSEIEFTIGLPYSSVTKPQGAVRKTPQLGNQSLNDVVFELYFDDVNAKVTVTYSWDGMLPVLSKVVNITNEGPTGWNRLLDIHLGTYATNAVPYKDPDWPVLLTKKTWQNAELDFWEDPAGQVRGYPAYLENQFFVGLAHPSGFSLLNGQKIELHHHPGIAIEPKQQYNSMQVVYGVANKGDIRANFRKHIYSRMRRVLRGHDHPYAIIDICGSQNNTGEDYFGVTEEWSLQHISKLAQAQKDAGLHFDNYVIEFWHDSKGDLKQCDPIRFPNNFTIIKPELNKLGTNLGLWISSGQYRNDKTMDVWTIGANPVLYDCSTDGNGKGRICRSTKPANEMYIDGLIYQIRTNHIRQIKLDVAGDIDCGCCFPWCNNPKHTHLTGDLYSIEANHNAQIELLTALDKECPEVFFTLYWGHYSPWWLLHGDTVYDTGSRMEMGSLALRPSLFARSSNVRRLDQGKYMASKDVPDIAWDSLGISLSDWDWNNRLGSYKWQEGVVMDMCRGSMLLHIWSDNDCIPVKDRPQMAEFISLLKARPECFRNPHPIGNPFKDNYWGYCCTDGKKAMIAIDNGSWEEQMVTLELNDAWGLPNNVEWDIYSWFPSHAKYESSNKKPFGTKQQIIIRPFTAILLEIVPRGQKPALDYDWQNGLIPLRFEERSRDIKTSSVVNKSGESLNFSVQGKLPLLKTRGWLAVTTEFIKDGNPFLSLRNKPVIIKGNLDGKSIEFESALDNPWYPAPWQTYRLLVNEISSGKEFQLSCTTTIPADVEIIIKGHFIPIDDGV